MPNEMIRQQNKQTVLKKAMKLFTENGVENTSVEMIARESHLTLRSVQNYYHTKNDLIAAVLNNGISAELGEMRSFFASEEYLGMTGAGQILKIVETTYRNAIEKADTVFCTMQMQHILSRMPGKTDKPQMTGNWLYVMEHLKSAFDKGVIDGSISESAEEKIIDEKSIMLALRGIVEQIAFTMCDRELRELFEPEVAVKKYVRQVELMISGYGSIDYPEKVKEGDNADG